MHSVLRPIQNERGATLVLVALVMVAMFGFLALAIDVGMLYSARAEAQRAADAAALAGASAYLDGPTTSAVLPVVDTRAREFAAKNTIRNTAVDTTAGSAEIQVDPDLATARVTVTVRRIDIPLWFAPIIGHHVATVSARATAVASPALGADCVKPVSFPDAWNETDMTHQDVSKDRIWDYEETWKYEMSLNDTYAPNGELGATGYGSEWRGPDRDLGRLIKLKLSNPHDASYPSIVQAWQAPDETGTSKPGYAHWKNSMGSCNPNAVFLNTSYGIQTGQGVGPTKDAIKELICKDPDAYWDESAKKIRGSSWPEGQSPRLATVPLYDPIYITSPGHSKIEFNNFAKMFFEVPAEWVQAGFSCTSKKAPNPDVVQGRFLYYVNGTVAGNNPGSLSRLIRLVQ